ncbi:hypothetical protein LGM42_01275 [Burkholderia sp. AU39826]|uniref:hypothetical protein n=1 Tax=Burkholderia TaxID=32008 RepID=UPI000ACF44F5|nr:MULTISPECIES: hypothetical protein [Burkholderia]MCA7968514.1 hypothetical protein [Burkholderia sp. AU39826]
MGFLRDEREPAVRASGRARACGAGAGEPRCGRTRTACERPGKRRAVRAQRAVQAFKRIGEAVTGFGKQAGRSGRRDARDASAGSVHVAAVACVVVFHRHRLTMRRTAINACVLINSFLAPQ